MDPRLPEKIEEMSFNPCILTGGNIWIMEHPAVIHGDFFLVGNTLIVTGYGEFRHLTGESKEDKAKLYDQCDCMVWMHDSLYKDLRFFAVPWRKVYWENQGEEKVKLNLSYDDIDPGEK